MKQQNRIYASIDLKSFYASVECIERGLDPMTTNLVVADASRTQKTICLAVSPALKTYGISGRARLFEVISRINAVNNERLLKLPGKEFTGKSYNANELKNSPDLEVSYITAVPRMAYYMEYSTRIYSIYLKYIAPEDIHVYSIDEVFIDLTNYLKTYKLNARQLVIKILKDVFDNTGITATAGIGTNLYLTKVAMDILAKHTLADENGVRIAELDEMSYRRLLWTHKPITDFWRVGKGYAKRLAENGMYTMGDVARCSIGKATDYYNEDLLYKLFGVNAELLIDHSWGWEPCTIADIKAYKPEFNSLSSGQVLQCPYDFDKAGIIVQEMTDSLVLDLVDKGLVTDQMVLTIGYDIENLTNDNIVKNYKGEVKTDRYGRKIPKHAHGTVNLKCKSSSTKLIIDAVMGLYEQIVDKRLLIRRITLVANNVVREDSLNNMSKYKQLNLFTDYNKINKEQQAKDEATKKEKNVQKTVLDIKKKFGKNAVLKGTSLKDGATAMSRNKQIGGHKA